MKKFAIFIITVYPAVYILFFLGLFASAFWGFSKQISSLISLIIPFHFLAMGSILFDEVFYITHALNNKKLKKDQRNMWVVAVFFTGPIAATVYYFKHYLKH